MKQSAFILFVITVLILYTLANIYLFYKGYRAIPDNTSIKYIYIILFLFFSLQFIITRILLLTDSSIHIKLFSEIGGIWLAAVLYLLITSLFIDLLSLSNHLIHFLPDLKPYKFIIFSTIVVAVFGLLIYGYFNAKSPGIKTLSLKVSKKTSINSLRIALVSDIHFGTIIDYSEIKNMIKLIEKEKPDILLVAGDLVDEGITKGNIAEIKPLFDNFQPKYGKIAVLGNHEYLNKIERTQSVFKQLGLELLRDSIVNLDNIFLIAGREDNSYEKEYNKKRKTVSEILKDADTSLPIILLDHQPYNLNEAVENSVDIQLSGHTHDGQMFPLNFLTKKAFEVSWGYLKKGNTHYYISSGFGTWGPRIRIGNNPEIVIINLTFD
ncbi:MAG: metallophosphoesterase [Bacteroidetes bacterium]|nr:MAG: metallophosphoesterase [Bacteroidota bacterium]